MKSFINKHNFNYFFKFVLFTFFEKRKFVLIILPLVISRDKTS